MPERVQQTFFNIVNRIRNFWTSLSVRQRVLIISSTAVVLIAAGILIFSMTRPHMIEIVTAKDADEAQKIQDVLSGEGIEFQTSKNGMTYTINEKDEAAASIALGTNSIPSKGYDISDVIDGSFSTTEADKKKRYQVYLEDKFAAQLETISGVKDAEVTLSIPDDDGTLIADTKDSYANVILTLSDDLDAKTAAGIAKYIATGLGNDTTDNITIIDSEGNSIFIGGEDTIDVIWEEDEEVTQDQETMAMERNERIRRDREQTLMKQVKQAFSSNNNGRAMFDNVEVSLNLSMDFDNTSSVDYHYYQDNADKTEGYLDSTTTKTYTSSGGLAGTPGTDSNDDETYVIEDDTTGSASSTEVTQDYLPSETITTKDGSLGKVDYENSSVTVVAYNNVIYNEERMQEAGLLEGTTFAQFVEENNSQQPIDIDENLITAVSNATSIPVERVSVVAYSVPMFQYAEDGRNFTDYLQIALAILIFALLGFVVFMTLRREREEEIAEEVTVEDLLEAQAQQDEQAEIDLEATEQTLDDIAYSDKTEARIVIEKFVDEKPEAAAALLRNWLNEDWG
ncbi:MAG: flagellar biosynthesis protein [Lachnospiraceae bacterium]|nr:flagellar biosynthesis protein [Lachnospiraceae bacterium]